MGCPYRDKGWFDLWSTNTVMPLGVEANFEVLVVKKGWGWNGPLQNDKSLHLTNYTILLHNIYIYMCVYM